MLINLHKNYRISLIIVEIITISVDLKMEADKTHIRHCMLFLFNQRKTAAEATRIICATYGDGILAEMLCHEWFQRFINGDFDLKDKKSSGQP